MSDTHGFAGIVRTFRDPNFRNFQIGSFIAWSGAWMYRTAVGWLTWQLTASPFWLGVVGFLNLMPAVVVSPIAGVLADRVDRLRYLKVAQAVALAEALIIGGLVVSGLITLEWVLALSLWHGITDAAIQPPNQAILPNLVKRDDMTTAYALNSLAFSLSRFAGPPVAGLLISWFGIGEAIFAYAGTIVIFILILARLKIGGGGHAKAGQRIDILGDIRAGISYAADHDGIGPMLAILVIMSLLSFPIVPLMPAFAEGVFAMGADGLAWLYAAMGAGAMVQGAFLAQRGPIAGLTSYIARTLAVMALAMIGLCATDIYAVGLAAVFGIGFANVASRSGIMTLMQHAADPAMRGRLASFYGVISRGGPALGALLIGALAEPFGLRLVYAVCGVLTLSSFFWMGARKARLAKALELGQEPGGGASKSG